MNEWNGRKWGQNKEECLGKENETRINKKRSKPEKGKGEWEQMERWNKRIRSGKGKGILYE